MAKVALLVREGGRYLWTLLFTFVRKSLAWLGVPDALFGKIVTFSSKSRKMALFGRNDGQPRIKGRHGVLFGTFTRNRALFGP